MTGSAQNAGLPRIAHVQVSRSNHVNRERVRPGIEAQRVLGARASHDPDQTIGGGGITVEEGEVGRKLIKEHHDGGFPLCLAFRKNEFVAAASHPFDVSNSEVDQFHGMAADFSERDPEIGFLPRSGNAVLRHSSKIGMWDLFF